MIGEAETKLPNIPWEWNETEVEAVILDTDSCEIVREKKITEFFVKLEVEGLGVGNIKKLIEVAIRLTNNRIKYSSIYL